MMRSLSTGLAIVLLMSAMSGCYYVPNDPDEPTQIIFLAEFTESDDEFIIEGEFGANGINPEKDTVEDVYLCLYDKNRSLIDAHYVGTVDTVSPNTSARVTTKEPPAYIVPESPDFWGDSFRTRGYRWDDGEYRKYTIETAAERFGGEDAASDGYTSCGDQ